MAFTKLYLTANAAPYTPATIRGAWDQTAGAVSARAFDTQKVAGGNLTTIGIAETNAAANFDVLLGRWVSGPLAAQTISGTVDVVLGTLESAAAADLAFHIHIYVTQGDSDTVRGTLLTDYVETTGNEWPTTATGKALTAAQTLTNIGAITAGDRLVVEIGYVALNASATSYTGTLNYGTVVAATGIPAGDLTAGSTSVTTLAGFLSFSVSITEATNPLRESQAVVEVLANDTPSVRVSQTAVEVLASDAPSLRVSQTVVEILWITSTLTPGGGGGGGPTGVNPTPGVVPSTVPEVFVVLTLDGVDYPFGVGQLNDDPTWYGGEKKGRVKDISSIQYQLTKQGGPQSVSFTVTLFDGDRVFHNRAGTTNQIKGGYCAVYVIDHDDRIAELIPKRLGAGYITSFSSEDDFTFKFTVKDALSVRLAKVDKEPLLPPGRFTLTDFPGLDPSMDGRAIPLVLGRVSDEDALAPQGEVPPIFVAQVNPFAYNGLGINLLTDVYVWAQGAFVDNGIVSVWYNPVGSPSFRVQTPAAAFGVVGATPFWPEWDTWSGLATNYIDYNGRRYTVMLIDASLPEATALREGNILIAANIYGTEDVGDTTGLMIDSPPRLTTFLLTNYVFTKYLTGAYNPIPQYEPETSAAYSWIDTDTFEDVHDYFVTRLPADGYTAGMLLGADGQAMTVFQFLQDMCEGVWMDIGVNLDGQLIASIYDAAGVPVDTFDAISDIEEGSYSVTLNEQRLVNRVEYEFGKYYLPPYGPSPTPAEGEPIPKPTPAYGEYRSGVQVVEDLVSQSHVGEVVPYTQQNKVVRNTTVAADVAGRILEEGLGPHGYGPHEFSFRGGWRLIENVTIGKNVNVRHPAIHGTGTTDLCRVTTIAIYPMQHRVMLGGDVISSS